MNLPARFTAQAGHQARCSALPRAALGRRVLCKAVVQNRHQQFEDAPDKDTVSRDATARASTSSSDRLADFGTRVTLERLYHNSRSGVTNHTSWQDVWSGEGAFFVSLEEKPQRTRNQERTPDYFANVGDAIRTLREDIPSLFEQELNCKYVYRNAQQ